MATLIRGLIEELPSEIVDRLRLGGKCFIGEADIVLTRMRLVALYFAGKSAQNDFVSPEIAEFGWFSPEEILRESCLLRPGMKEVFVECLTQGLLFQGGLSLSKSLREISQNLTMVSPETPDIAL